MSDEVEFEPGKLMLAGKWEWDAAKKGWVVAVDPDSGAVKWKYNADAPVVAGITPTAGGVTFTGDMGGNFLALESATGKVLLKTPTAGALAGGVITYALGGKQYVAITSGNVSRLSFGENGKPSVVIYALPGSGQSAATTPAPQPAASAGATVASLPPDAGRGMGLYNKNCAACHGTKGEGVSGPALVGASKRPDFAATVQWIENPSEKMPRLYPSTIDAQAVADIAAYVLGL